MSAPNQVGDKTLRPLLTDLLDLAPLKSQEHTDYPTLVDVRGVLMTVL